MDYLGIPVLTEPPNRRDAMRGGILRSRTRLDTAGGLFTDDERTLGARERIEFTWSALDRSAAAALQAFLDTCKGRLTPFWMPTWRPDLTLAADYLDPGSTMDVIYVQAARLTAAVTSDYRRSHLVVIRPDGTPLQPFGWDAMTDNGDGTETLNLASGPGADLLVADRYMLSWLQLMRLDTDEPLVTWFNFDLAEIRLQAVTLPRETPAP